jgi:hypothetical protein
MAGTLRAPRKAAEQPVAPLGQAALSERAQHVGPWLGSSLRRK